MTELLKIDFRRVLKDKLLIVVGILAATFALITPILRLCESRSTATASEERSTATIACFG